MSPPTPAFAKASDFAPSELRRTSRRGKPRTLPVLPALPVLSKVEGSLSKEASETHRRAVG